MFVVDSFGVRILFYTAFILIVFGCDKQSGINYTDGNNKKQGYWMELGKDRPNSCYGKDQKVGEGFYVDGKKEGMWLQYFCNGKFMESVSFREGRPNGVYCLYYKSGKPRELGVVNGSRFSPPIFYDINGKRVARLDNLEYEE